jgi:hypothetical protein
MAGLLEFALDRLISVEFSIDDDDGLAILAGNRLLPPVGAPVMQTMNSPLQC